MLLFLFLLFFMFPTHRISTTHDIIQFGVTVDVHAVQTIGSFDASFFPGIETKEFYEMVVVVHITLTLSHPHKDKKKTKHTRIFYFASDAMDNVKCIICVGVCVCRCHCCTSFASNSFHFLFQFYFLILNTYA